MNKKEILAESDRLEDAGKVDEALVLLESALKVAPNDLDYLVDHGRILTHSCGKPLSGLLDYEKAISVNPASPIPYQHICLAEMLLGNYERATEAAKNALAIDPKNPNSIYLLGKCYLDNGMVESSLPLLELSTKLERDASDNWSTLGRAYEKAGRLDQSLCAYQRVCELSEDAITNISIARIHILLGNIAKAHDSLDRAFQLPMDEAQKKLAETTRETAINASVHPNL